MLRQREGRLTRGAWWGQWFGGPGPGNGEALHLLLTRIWRKETALACHLAERARTPFLGPEGDRDGAVLVMAEGK